MDYVELEEMICYCCCRKLVVLWKPFLKQSWNECVWRVRASGYAMDHFWRMRDLNIQFWGKNGENSWPKHAKMRVSQRCAWGRALGAHSQRASAGRYTPGARRPGQDNMLVVPRSGAWGQSCRDSLRPFEGVLLLFSLTLLLEHNWLGRNLDFINGLKLCRFWFSDFVGKWTFVNKEDDMVSLQFIWT